MGGCSAINCSNHSRKGFQMARLPKNEERRKKWIINMRRENWQPGPSAQICIILDPEFGLYVWPSAPVLSKYIWTYRSEIKNKNILELGAGTALPSIVAAKCGAQVTVTDSEKFKYVLNLGEYNMLQNNVSCDMFKISEITWGQFTPYIMNTECFDLILGSDVFYNPEDFEDVLVTVSYFLKRNSKGEFWCTYEHRCSDWNIIHLLKKWNLKCVEIPLSSFGADKFNVAGADLPGLKTISLYIISYCSEI